MTWREGAAAKDCPPTRRLSWEMTKRREEEEDDRGRERERER